MIVQPKFLRTALPLYEYPRPQFRRNSYYSLNGVWEYAFLPEESFSLGYKSVPEQADGEIIVPYSPESPLSKVGRELKREETLCYRLRFHLPSDMVGGRTLLHFGAVDQVCKVYCNSGLVGSHAGGYTPFTLDLTKFLHERGENELVVLVKDDASSDVYGRGKQSYRRGGIWYKAISGIWQSVWMESVPFNYLTSVRITPDAEKKTIKMIAYSYGGDKQVMTVRIFDGEKLLLTEHLWSDTEEEIAVPFCKEWSPDSPELYDIDFTMGEDNVRAYFALRSFSLVDKGVKLFALNGKPVFFNGLLDQGYWGEGIYTPRNNYEMYERLFRVRSLGYNMLRKHIKVEPLLWYYYCDILGIVVWQDMVNGGAPYKKLWINLGPFVTLRLSDKNYKGRGRDNPASREQYLLEAEETVDTLYNSPCVALWTPFNECWGQFDTVKVCQAIQALDGTRWVDHASGWCDKGAGDVYSRHVYFKKVKLKNDGKRVLALTEFGGYSMKAEGQKKFGYAYFTDFKRYRQAYDELYRGEILPALEEGLCATVYTQLADVEEESNGIFTESGELKLDEGEVTALNQALYDRFNELWGEESRVYI